MVFNANPGGEFLTTILLLTAYFPALRPFCDEMGSIRNGFQSSPRGKAETQVPIPEKISRNGSPLPSDYFPRAMRGEFRDDKQSQRGKTQKRGTPHLEGI
jgi:hypothetical protein